jgi:hypothetical protein
MKVTRDNAGALLLIRQAIPCILDCKNVLLKEISQDVSAGNSTHFAGETK